MPSVAAHRTRPKATPGAVRLCASGLHRAERCYRRVYATNVTALNTLRSWERFYDMSEPFAGVAPLCRADVPLEGAWVDFFERVYDLVEVDLVSEVAARGSQDTAFVPITLDYDAWMELDEDVRESLIEDLVARVRASRSAPIRKTRTMAPPASQCRLMASSTVGANAPPRVRLTSEQA